MIEFDQVPKHYHPSLFFLYVNLGPFSVITDIHSNFAYSLPRVQ